MNVRNFSGEDCDIDTIELCGFFFDRCVLYRPELISKLIFYLAEHG